MSFSLANATIDLNLREKQAIGGMDKVERRLAGFQRKAEAMASTFARIGVVGGAAIGGIAVGLFKLASDAEEAGSKFDVVFGGAAGGLGASLDKFADAAGRSRFELRSMAGDIGALIGPMGFTSSETARLSNQIVKLAVDLGSFNNIPATQALIALRAALVGEAEPMRRLGVQLSAAKIEAEAFASGLVTTTEQIDGQVKALATMNIIMRETAAAQGDAVRTADSAANQYEKLKAQFKDTATELGQKLLPAMTAFLEQLNEVVPVVAAFVMANGEAIVRTLAWAASLVAVGFVITKTIRIISGIVSAIKAIRTAMIAMLALSGPAGWGVLAAGAVVAAGAIWAADAAFDGIQDSLKATQQEAQKAAEEAERLATAYDGVAASANSAADAGMQMAEAGKLNAENVEKHRKALEALNGIRNAPLTQAERNAINPRGGGSAQDMGFTERGSARRQPPRVAMLGSLEMARQIQIDIARASGGDSDQKKVADNTGKTVSLMERSVDLQAQIAAKVGGGARYS